MYWAPMRRAVLGSCPKGSSSYLCGGGQVVFWSGCCSVNGCASGQGCPRDADISISVAPGAPWPGSLSTESPKATSDVGAPVTAGLTVTTTILSTFSLPASAIVATEPGVYDPTPTPSLTSAPPTTVATSTVQAATTTAHPQPGEVNTEALSQTTIAGIGIGGAIGLLGLLFLVFLLCRRHKHAKRMPSYREGLRNEYEKDASQNSQAIRGNNADVFAPFGGRASSLESSKPLEPAPPSAYQSTRSRIDVGAAISGPSSPAGSSFVSPVSSQSTAVPLLRESLTRNTNTIAEEEPEKVTQLDSTPVYFELDSADTAKRMAELPMPSPPRNPRTTEGLCHDPDSSHPEGLMPGSFPNVVKDAQRQKLTRVQSGDTSVVSVGQVKGQSTRPGSYDHPSRLRATMNATSDDVQRNRHVNSWTHL